GNGVSSRRRPWRRLEQHRFPPMIFRRSRAIFLGPNRVRPAKASDGTDTSAATASSDRYDSFSNDAFLRVACARFAARLPRAGARDSGSEAEETPQPTVHRDVFPQPASAASTRAA